MADLASYGNSDYDIEKVETSLIWISHGEEKHMKLSIVSHIIPGQRIICKDKAELELWILGLKTLISSRQLNRHNRSDISYNGFRFGAKLELNSGIVYDRISIDSISHELLNFRSSDVGLERSNMQPRTSIDGFRVSVSSTPSCSSVGSGPDDIESLGDVYIWGEVLADGVSSEASGNHVFSKTDVLLPKPLESNVVLDVHQIASGVHHIALVTRQGEVFTWGEESGGRLGHGVDEDFGRPHLVDLLTSTNVDFVACGEYHTCAVSTSGDLFSWGDGTHNVGLLGHGTTASHWIPKRVCGPLEGLQVLSIACGLWHSALATNNGKLFTFGDGTFGVLGHGDRESVSYPKEVQQLSGLKTIRVACGVWHTAVIVEVMCQSGSNVMSRKLFTWGDGDKYRLGHGNKETYLQPSCVSALIDYNFHQIACGHTMTVALTTSGHVFTMGGTTYGQLGNPSSDGKTPIQVQDKLAGEFVEEISCGSHHVAILTSRSELYTWGRGANGRLGHGDIEDRKFPTLVETLRDRHVKNISCGSNFTSCICIHKWVSGADQSICTGCRQAFGFTRKRHNCYNCGLVHCHACSSRKVLKAALAPTPGKPHRVCDACFTKLKAAESGPTSSLNRRVTPSRHSLDGSERLYLPEIRPSRVLFSPTIEPMKYLEVKIGKSGTRYRSSSMVRASQVPSSVQLKDVAFPSSLSVIQNVLKPIIPLSPSVTAPSVNSRPTSPYARRPSPPRVGAPGFSKSLIDSLRKTNELLNQEVSKMQNQTRTLKQKNDIQDIKIQKLQKNVKKSISLAGKESSKHKVAMEFIKSITNQLKEMMGMLSLEDANESLRTMHTKAQDFLKEYSEPELSSLLQSSLDLDHHNASGKSTLDDDLSKVQEHIMEENVVVGVGLSQDSGNVQESNKPSVSNSGIAVPSQSSENGSRSPSKPGKEGEKQVIEQFEPGVYITLIVLPNGSKVFKRVRFSKRRFDEHQAEEWWTKNKDRVLRKYNPSTSNHTHIQSSSILPSFEENIEASPSET